MITFLNAGVIAFLGLNLSLIPVNPVLVHPIEIETGKPAKVTPFNRIIVSGNVEILLVSRPTVGIHYADDNEGRVNVTQQGNVLRIYRGSTAQTKVVVSISNIYRIEAQDDSIVRSDGLLTAKFLQIIMKGNAKADVNVNVEGLYSEITERSVLKL